MSPKAPERASCRREIGLGATSGREWSARRPGGNSVTCRPLEWIHHQLSHAIATSLVEPDPGDVVGRLALQDFSCVTGRRKPIVRYNLCMVEGASAPCLL